MKSYLFWHVILPKYQRIECSRQKLTRLDQTTFEPLIRELFHQGRLHQAFPPPLQNFVLEASLDSTSINFSVYYQGTILTVSALNLQSQMNQAVWHRFLDKFEDLYFVPAIPSENPWLLSYVHRPIFLWLPDLLEEIAILLLQRNS